MRLSLSLSVHGRECVVPSGDSPRLSCMCMSLPSLQLLVEQPLTHAGSPEEARRVRSAARRAVAAGLARAAVLVAPEAHPGGWADFAAAFAVRGGVIEACPLEVLGSPTVNVRSYMHRSSFLRRGCSMFCKETSTFVE